MSFALVQFLCTDLLQCYQLKNVLTHHTPTYAHDNSWFKYSCTVPLLQCSSSKSYDLPNSEITVTYISYHLSLIFDPVVVTKSKHHRTDADPVASFSHCWQSVTQLQLLSSQSFFSLPESMIIVYAQNDPILICNSWNLYRQYTWRNSIL